MIVAKRDIFAELMEGVAAIKSHREGKLTLRSFKVESAPLPIVDAKVIRGTRQKLGCSRAVFARQLRINLRTLGKWEQGRSQPNPQATEPNQTSIRRAFLSGLRAMAMLRSRSFSRSLSFSEKERAWSRWRVARLLSRTLRIQSLIDNPAPRDRSHEEI